MVGWVERSETQHYLAQNNVGFRYAQPNLPRRGTEAVITAPTRNRMGSANSHVGSNPTLSEKKLRNTSF